MGEPERRLSNQDELRGLRVLSTAEIDVDGAGGEHGLVDVEVADRTGVLLIVASELPGELLREPVADRVRMTGTLALDELDGRIVWRATGEPDVHAVSPVADGPIDNPGAASRPINAIHSSPTRGRGLC